jgi:hypothetical protein
MPAFHQFQSQELKNVNVSMRIMNHRRVEQCKYVTIEALARFLQSLILINSFPVGLEKILHGDKQSLALFASLGRPAHGALRTSPCRLILELCDHSAREIVMSLLIGDD